MPKKQGISPVLKDVLNYLTESGVLGRYKVRYDKDSPYLSLGQYSPGENTVAVISGGPDWGDYTAAHETVHGLLRTRGQTDRMRDLWKKLPLKDRADIVFPRSWERGEVAQPLTEGKERTVYYGPDDDPYKWSLTLSDKAKVAPVSKSRMAKMFSESQKKQLTRVRKGIHGDWSFSGIANLPEKDRTEDIDTIQEEGLAYYLTSDELGDLQKRARDYGRFLMNYGVPDKLAIAAYKELARPEKQKPGSIYRYRGGGLDLHNMTEAMAKELEVLKNAQMAP